MIIAARSSAWRAVARSISTPLRLARAHQRRWAQVHDVRFLVTHERQSAVFDKYKSKLEQKAKEQGKSLEELKEAYIQAKKPAGVPHQPPPPPSPVSDKPEPVHNVQTTPSTSDVHAAQKTSNTPVKTLSSYIDIEKTAALPHKEIEAIWRLRHVKDPQSLCAVVTSDVFERIAQTAKQHPQFILPIPRDEGAEIHFMQWTFPSPTTTTVLFTHLAEFKLRGEFAQPHTTVTHHTDLQQSNGLVLMEGRVMEGRGISLDEAKWLLFCLQKFYGQANRQKLVKQFTDGDENFKVEELLEEAERMP